MSSTKPSILILAVEIAHGHTLIPFLNSMVEKYQSEGHEIEYFTLNNNKSDDSIAQKALESKRGVVVIGGVISGDEEWFKRIKLIIQESQSKNAVIALPDSPDDASAKIDYAILQASG